MRKSILHPLITPLRLSIITQFYPPDYAATGQLIEELASHLGEQGIQVKVFTGQPGYAFQKNSAPVVERSPQVEVRRSRASQIWPQRIRGKAIGGLLFCIRSALHLLKTSSHGDILLLTTAPPYLPIIGYLAHLIFGVPYVCLLYDLYPDIAVELRVISQKHWLTRIWDFCNRKIWKSASEIIVLSSTMKERIVAKHPQLADKITVIHSWSNPDWITPIPKDENWFAHQYNLVRKFTVLYSGNMGRCHDMDTILAAAEQLRDEPVEFVFIGGGAKRQICLKKIEEQGLTNCRFLPYQEKQFLPYSLTACDLALVSISPGMEGLVAPSKLYGSLAAGRPVAVICEPHSYLRPLLAESGCGEAFEHGDAKGLAQFIRSLAASPWLSQDMGQAGRSYLKCNFTLDIIAQQYARVFYRSLKRPFIPFPTLPHPIERRKPINQSSPERS